MPSHKTKLMDCPLVLLAGTGCDERVFDPLIIELSKTLVIDHVIIKSVGNQNSAELEAKLLKEQLPEKYVLAGFSLGGIVALSLYFIDKARIAGLILIDSNARADSAVNGVKRVSHLERIRSQGLKHLIIDDWPKQVARKHSRNEALKSLLVAMAENTGLERLSHQTQIALNRVNSLALLSELSVPMLIVAGEEDIICTPEMQQEIAQAVPHSTLKFISEAGHYSLLENPVELARAIWDFYQNPISASKSIRIERDCKLLN